MPLREIMRGTISLDVKTNSHGIPSGRQGETQLHDTRPCNLCARGRIPVADTKKSCVTCRDKKRNYNQAKKRKLLALTTVEEEKGGEEDLSGVLEEMKKRLKKQIYRPGTSGSLPFQAGAKNPDPNYIEFQTATDMYKALRLQSKSGSLHFHGSFSIIAVLSVNNSKRQRLVTQELKKVAKLSFEYDKPMLLGSVLAYKCACKNHNRFPQPQSRTSLLNAVTIGEPAPQKRRQIDLPVWTGLGPKGTKMSPVTCMGMIFINSEDDHSHPAGIKGQRITVKVEH